MVMKVNVTKSRPEASRGSAGLRTQLPGQAATVSGLGGVRAGGFMETE